MTCGGSRLGSAVFIVAQASSRPVLAVLRNVTSGTVRSSSGSRSATAALQILKPVISGCRQILESHSICDNCFIDSDIWHCGVREASSTCVYVSMDPDTHASARQVQGGVRRACSPCSPDEARIGSSLPRAMARRGRPLVRPRCGRGQLGRFLSVVDLLERELGRLLCLVP